MKILIFCVECITAFVKGTSISQMEAVSIIFLDKNFYVMGIVGLKANRHLAVLEADSGINLAFKFLISGEDGINHPF
jgi:hypothetical protein